MLVSSVKVSLRTFDVDYSSRTNIYESTTDVQEGSFTVTEDGFIQGYTRTQGTLGSAFMRLYINNVTIYEGYSVEGQYAYLWSPIFKVKKSDVVRYTLKTYTEDGKNSLFFYKHG